MQHERNMRGDECKMKGDGDERKWKQKMTFVDSRPRMLSPTESWKIQIYCLQGVHHLGHLKRYRVFIKFPCVACVCHRVSVVIFVGCLPFRHGSENLPQKMDRLIYAPTHAQWYTYAGAYACIYIYLSIYPSIHPSIYPTIHLSIYLSIDMCV